jgi:predicted PurR-regulated permease PerM
MNQGFIPRWKKVSLPNKLSVLCTAIIAIATVFYVIASFWQLDRKSKTLEEMRTNRDGSTGQANQVIENLNWLARTMEESLRRNQEAMKVIEKQSQDALNASINAARQEYRPWVSALGNSLIYAPGTINGPLDASENRLSRSRAEDTRPN